MLDALRVIAVILGVMVLIFLAAVGYVMWKYRIPPRGLVAIGAAMVYLVSPIDVLPEALLGPIGLVDDAGVLVLAVAFLMRLATAQKMLADAGVDLGKRRGGPRDPARVGLGNDPRHPVVATEAGTVTGDTTPGSGAAGNTPVVRRPR